jgi:D-amino-acid oxidase
MIPCYRLTTEDPIGNPSWKHVVYGFRELSDVEVGKLSKEHGRNYTSGCHFVTFCCQPIKFLPFITKRFLRAGGKLETRKIQSFDDIRDADLIINCTGMGSRELGDERVHPIRGQITRVKALWMNNVFIDESDDGNYIIPNAETVVLGGTHQVNDYNLKVSIRDDDFIHNGCKRIAPSIANAERVQDIVGLRPGRNQVRLEIESRKDGKATIIHNAGFENFISILFLI